jgi:hypothetical protein
MRERSKQRGELNLASSTPNQIGAAEAAPFQNSPLGS